MYENFAAAYGEQYEIRLFVRAYEKMLSKAESIGTDNLPVTKEGQNRNIGSAFLSSFPQSQQTTIRDILARDRYIPQEILNRGDFV